MVVHAMQDKGIARCSLGDPGGMDDLRASLTRSLELGLGFETTTAYINLADFEWDTGGPAKALVTHREGIEFSKRRGISSMWATGETTWMLYDLGQWEELIQVADEVTAWDRDRGGSQIELLVVPYKVMVLAHRGNAAEGSSLVDAMLRRTREVGDPQILLPALVGAALTAEAAGDGARALALIEEYLEVSRDLVYRLQYPDAMRILLREGGIERTEEAVQGLDSWMARFQHTAATVAAMVAEAREELEEAARRYDEVGSAWEGYGFALEHGQALLGAGRCLARLRRFQEAVGRLRAARELLSSLGARPLIGEADSWLTNAIALSS